MCCFIHITSYCTVLNYNLAQDCGAVAMVESVEGRLIWSIMHTQVNLYLCICVFVYLCICVFVYYTDLLFYFTWRSLCAGRAWCLEFSVSVIDFTSTDVPCVVHVYICISLTCNVFCYCCSTLCGARRPGALSVSVIDFISSTAGGQPARGGSMCHN